jgi:hypothetical protein
MKKDRRLADTQSAKSLVMEAQAARIKEHIRALLSRLKSRNQKPERDTE